MRKTPSEAEILRIAGAREFAVNVYGEGHEALRKLTRRMFRDGKLVMDFRTKKQFFYRAKPMPGNDA